ncbi:MAG TPA: hypothetical protein VGC66_12680 [Pyrinomonadaceae bacterium]|jgi:hypothetical protein
MKSDQDETAHAAEDAGVDEMSEEEIDATLEDTFPASDPPAWTLGSDHPSNTKQPPETNDAKDD